MNGRGLHIAMLLLAASSAAWADGVGGYVEENYSHTTSTITDPAGTRTTEQDEMAQMYRLNLDRSFWPLLRFSGYGAFEQINDWRSGYNAGDSWTRTNSAFATLMAGNNFLNGAAAYNYQVQKASFDPTTLVLEEPSVSVGWRPTDLPSLSLRLSRQHVYDTQHRVLDLATPSALLASAWKPVRELSLQYAATYLAPEDRLHDTTTTSVSQLFRADWLKPNLWESRATAGAGLGLMDRRTKVTSAGAGGQLVTLQTPFAGLSAIERFPATADLDTLASTPALIDGNTTDRTAIDLGYSLPIANDTDARDLGLQFSDILTHVNTLYVWVNQLLPDTVWRSFQWTAWKSDDNLHWTQVPIVAPVAFGVLQNRFEITIQDTAAPYLKLVTRPLDPVVAANDRRFADIYVTELQPLLITSVTRVSDWQAVTAATANASFRTMVFTRDLTYDFNGLLTRTASTGRPTIDTYLISNGLSYVRKLSSILLFSSRVARQDMDQSTGHQGILQYSASLAATPLPTLGHNLVYSGQAVWAPNGTTTTNAISLYNRAIPYRGISLMAGGSWSIVGAPGGQVSRTAVLTANAILQPHRSLTLSGVFGHSDTVSTGGGYARSSQATNRIDANVAFNPFPALYLAGGLTRIVTAGGPRTLFNGTVNVSPFPGGDLQLGMTYTETYQQGGPLDGSTTRLFIPSVRWAVRPGTLLTVSYTRLDSGTPTTRDLDRTFNANLQIAL